MARLALANLDDTHLELRAALEGCVERGAPPPVDVGHVADWCAIATWLTTKDGKGIRKSPAGMPGIPPIGKGPGSDARRDDAHAVAAWLEALAGVPGLVDAFATCAAYRRCATRTTNGIGIASMLSLLPELAARLATVFAERASSTSRRRRSPRSRRSGPATSRPTCCCASTCASSTCWSTSSRTPRTRTSS